MPDPVTLKTLVVGFLQARSRFEAARLEAEPGPAFHALFESLSWAVSIDERLKHPQHPELRGLRYARHSIHHRWADALELDEEGAELPTTLPLAFFEWRWRRELPPPKRRDDEPFYLEHLAGRPARRSLDAVRDFLERQ